MCIDIVEISLGIAHRKISSIFDRVICPGHDNEGVLSFHVTLSGRHHKMPTQVDVLLNKNLNNAKPSEYYR